jgi:hypothetical protein
MPKVRAGHEDVFIAHVTNADNIPNISLWFQSQMGC